MRFPVILFLAATIARAEIPLEPAIAVQPLGTVGLERLEVVRKGLEEAFGLKVDLLEPKALPTAAWYAPRERYRAEKLLAFLAEVPVVSYRIVVGITSKDISTTKGEHKDWGIFGLGEVDGRACVVSTFRLGARGADEKKLRERLKKVAVHEVGHVIGLPHCPEKGCVMQDAESSIATVDAETGTFCRMCKAACLQWLKKSTKSLPGN